jgi:hypothetical protein
MGRLTIDIPESTHHHLKVMAANRGITIRDFVLEKIIPDLTTAIERESSLKDMASAWEKRRQEFKLDRGERSWAEIIHEDHPC